MNCTTNILDRACGPYTPADVRADREALARKQAQEREARVANGAQSLVDAMMAKVPQESLHERSLVQFGSSGGATAEIAEAGERAVAKLRDCGWNADVYDIGAGQGKYLRVKYEP